ncbi:MAG: BatA domain-containing protein [Chthoniobacterales bacterium]
MSIIFSNPWGLLALLGIPIILLIHLLQRQSRRVLTSTLFLIEHLTPLSLQGRRIEKLRNSLPLWLQILAVLLLAWLLAGPTWLRKDSQQTIVVVLDSSLSMRAFEENIFKTLSSRLPDIARTSAHTKWILLETDPAKETLYSGGRLEELLAQLKTWKPDLGTHDFTPTLQTARSLEYGNSFVVFITDRETSLPEGVESIRIGEAIENCGFTGLQLDGNNWTALIKNFGSEAQTRQWWIESEKSEPQHREVTIQPGETLLLKGQFPVGEDRCELVLSGDEFSVDDRLPIVREHLKTLNISNKASSSTQIFFERFASSIKEASLESTPVDLTLQTYDPFAPGSMSANAIISVDGPRGEKSFRKGDIVKERHPLMEDLNFQNLIIYEGFGMPLKEDDEVLLWQGNFPVLFLRSVDGAKTLCINFDITLSNADRVPSFVVLLNRFAESVRESKIAPEQRNFESNQRIQLAHDTQGPPLKGGRSEILPRAPTTPAFFEISQGDKKLLSGAAHFADVREADFKNAESADSLDLRIDDISKKNRRSDIFAPLWILLLGVICISNWAAQGRRRDQ